MGRRKKKIADPAESMERLLKRAVELFREPYDDRNRRDPALPSVRAVSEKMGTTILRTRKLLITAGYYSTHMSRWVEVGETAFILDQTTVNADRHRVFRKRVKAVKLLREQLEAKNAEEYLWEALEAFQGYPFVRMEDGKRFSYRIEDGMMILTKESVGMDRETMMGIFWEMKGRTIRAEDIGEELSGAGYPIYEFSHSQVFFEILTTGRKPQGPEVPWSWRNSIQE